MTTIGIKMDGMQALLAQLNALGGDVDEALEMVAFDMATETQALAIAGIQGGPKSGRSYRRGNVVHQASSPGQYPATDLGRLVGSVRLVQQGPTDFRVGTAIDYGPHLEFGTAKMAARPWLLPSFERARIGVEKELRARIEAMLK